MRLLVCALLLAGSALAATPVATDKRMVPALVGDPAGDKNSVPPLLPNQDCGCVLLEVCPCRKYAENVEVVTTPPKQIEVVDNLPHNQCGCLGCHPCVDNRYAAPEILEKNQCGQPPCGAKLIEPQIDGEPVLVHPAVVDRFTNV